MYPISMYHTFWLVWLFSHTTTKIFFVCIKTFIGQCNGESITPIPILYFSLFNPFLLFLSVIVSSYQISACVYLIRTIKTLENVPVEPIVDHFLNCEQAHCADYNIINKNLFNYEQKCCALNAFYNIKRWLKPLGILNKNKISFPGVKIYFCPKISEKTHLKPKIVN